MQRETRSAGRQKSAAYVLCIHTGFDRVAARLQVGLRERKCFACRDAELQLDEVESPDHLRNGMFDLESRVHLHEVRLVGTIARDDELDRSGVDVAACPCRRHSLSRDRIPLARRIRTGDGASSITFW